MDAERKIGQIFYLREMCYVLLTRQERCGTHQISNITGHTNEATLCVRARVSVCEAKIAVA